MKKFIEEFKTFAMRGNVLDLAVAVVIGGAFGKIVTSLTDDIIMPVIGLITGGMDFSNLAWILKEAVGDTPAVTIKYGLFINNIVTFIIIAFVIFVLIKAINKLKKQEEETPKKAPKPSNEEVLLTEIRDILKKS
jgi:large conductance mechanosensitive channel